MDGPTVSKLAPFSTVGWRELINVADSLRRPLSGYIGTSSTNSEKWVNRLETEWEDLFCVGHAKACNSATSGLLAACRAAGVRIGDLVWTTPYTMSATAACPLVLGANVRFIDIEPDRFSIDPELLTSGEPPKAIIVTNLFGHPAHLQKIRNWADSSNVVMIEDNSHAPLAMEDSSYTGTVGHMGVFSLNVHKHIQSGEGGIVVTNQRSLAGALGHAINHGELRDGSPGLNLRMAEPIAAIACAQVRKLTGILGRKRHIAYEICNAAKGAKWMRPSREQPGCVSSWYVWSATIENKFFRRQFVRRMRRRGFLVNEGYVKPLHKLFNTDQSLPVVESIEDSIVTFEMCSCDPTDRQVREMCHVMEYVIGEIDALA